MKTTVVRIATCGCRYERGVPSLFTPCDVMVALMSDLHGAQARLRILNRLPYCTYPGPQGILALARARVDRAHMRMTDHVFTP